MQDQRDETRMKQVEESLLQMQQLIGEMKSEIEALGDVIVVTAASMDSVSRGALLKRLSEAADVQRALQRERTANALETLVAAAEVDGKPIAEVTDGESRLDA